MKTYVRFVVDGYINSPKNILPNTPNLYIVHIDMYLNNTYRKDCCFSIAKMVTRTRHSFLL